ncbi:MarR family winged helix-turn-helix transcriptional regulator [Chachezhania sediminis]|uniref:MarR family winged helix-turn-helix transcriptional regulator n=1 Tax=Chachezhania sediminis TaxID=2599291 RepID=UPI00131AAC54|nr:MarR family transcriptional regulator [Chachezhania sediminis]
MTEDQQTENAVGLIFQHVARLRNRLYDRGVEGHGLTSAQVYAINHLFRQDGRSQVELAGLLGIGTVALSGLVDRMEGAGWVARQPDPKDRRTKRIWLTDAARAKRPALEKAARAVNDTSLAGFSPEEVETLLDMLRRVRTNLTEALDPPAGTG